jgi:hypothetical protein
VDEIGALIEELEELGIEGVDAGTDFAEGHGQKL